MIPFELTNEQRQYFGLDAIKPEWEKVSFKGDTYRPESILYFEGAIIKRHIVSTEKQYIEKQYNELTSDRTILLPKTAKGKEKKLTASVLEQQRPTGVYLDVSCGSLMIGSYATQTTFYSTLWESNKQSEKDPKELINEFIETSPENHLEDILQFKNAKRKNVKFKSGDYFAFKLNRTNYGFGRVLLDINKIRKKGLIPKEHGLFLPMGPPVFVELFIYQSSTKDVSISLLDAQPKLPSDLMMDNLLLYGEYEIIGYREIKDEEFDFPISYGRSIDQRRVVFLQWGLIHRELPYEKFYKYISADTPTYQNPYGYYSIGFRPHYDTTEIIRSIENKGRFEFDKSEHYAAKWDLRNPANKAIKDELFEVFGLFPDKSYFENCKLTGTSLTTEFVKIP
ncbi:immunity 26/phosphotriesterase HocA family protein [Desertivirga xinjiangensis]|uniref:immunity 26/phosphotriesterase HocA family protein n=1 Tax=Desertivirga xinjiangensis TaxID=539206 RepID=UPI00210AC392|nr:immunity 26/phosphotriesterase HocA family protein [Pedobacter xinjiangensis]